MIAQSGHAIIEFSKQFSELYNNWYHNSNYLIILEIDNEEKLKRLFYKLQDNDANVVAFTEPDINDQLTSICYYGTPEMRKITQKLDLALEC
jgi:chaperonin GroEL (HSP60 family)